MSGLTSTGRIRASARRITRPTLRTTAALTINLLGVSAGGGQSSNFSVPMGVLLGDATESRKVTHGDVKEVKVEAGQVVDGTNFRADVTRNGTIDSKDGALTKSKLGTSLH